jgi:hypothetical protein
MARIVITAAEFQALASKLDSVVVLSDKERLLLLAIFRLAGLAVAERARGTVSETETAVQSMASSINRPSAPMSLSDGFEAAFRPIGSASIGLDRTIEATSVSIGLIW